LRWDDASVNERDAGPDLSIEEAAVQLGMSPTAVISLLENGQLPSHLGPDGRRRRVLAADVDKHRHDRFELRQKRVQEQRARRWADPNAPTDAGLDLETVLDGSGPA
jgi:excisionase family DNA binding protein